MVVFHATMSPLLGLLLLVPATAQQPAAEALLAWCEANPQATMCESSWRESSDPWTSDECLRRTAEERSFQGVYCRCDEWAQTQDCRASGAVDGL